MKVKILLSLSVCLMLSACLATSRPLVKIGVDDRTLEDCPDTFPGLSSADDTVILNWSQDLLVMYAECARKKRSLSTSIKDFNANIEAANQEISKIVK